MKNENWEMDIELEEDEIELIEKECRREREAEVAREKASSSADVFGYFDAGMMG